MAVFKWVKDAAQLKPSPDTYDWLTKPYILSQSLKRICQNFTVSLLVQEYQQVNEDERKILNLTPGELPLVRQVLLKDTGRPLTCGRVVIPKATACQIPQLNDLGTNLIGETLLYHNSNVTRSSFEFAQLFLTDPLVSQLLDLIGFNITQESLWARRSVFSIKSAPLLITDIFLPNLGPYVHLLNDEST